MKRRSPAVIALLVVLGLGALSWVQSQRRDARLKSEAAARDAEFAAAQEAEDQDRETPDAQDSEAPAAELPSPESPAPSSARFDTLPDGSPIPPLPAETPTRVKVGLSIFRYKGAQAPPTSDRSREAALELAREAAAKASEDFDAAVAMGDQGSDTNVGWMKRGFLEPAVEYAVFTLSKGEVQEEPIDTPRGFWVVKRIR